MTHFLTIPEELFLLAVHEKDGNTNTTQRKSFKVAMAGAILMNLALDHRIDNDLRDIMVDDIESTDDLLLDIVFNQIILDESPQIDKWINKLAEDGDVYNTMILNSLMGKGILEIKEEKIFWVFSTRKYPIVDNSEIKEVRSRIREIVFSDEIPEIQDLVLISLLHYGKLLDLVFSSQEIKKHDARIDQIAKMDLIGQTMSKKIEKSKLPQFLGHLREVL